MFCLFLETYRLSSVRTCLNVWVRVLSTLSGFHKYKAVRDQLFELHQIFHTRAFPQQYAPLCCFLSCTNVSFLKVYVGTSKAFESWTHLKSILQWKLGVWESPLKRESRNGGLEPTFPCEEQWFLLNLQGSPHFESLSYEQRRKKLCIPSVMSNALYWSIKS